MRLDPNRFRKTLNDLRPQLLNPRFDVMKRVGEAAVGSHVPIVAVALFVLRTDVLGELPAIRDLVTRLTEFYRYDEIIAWSDLQDSVSSDTT